MSDNTHSPALTPALEDYLETIYRLMSKTGSARVRDIADARNVRPGSVSPAMKRLDQMGLIEYEKREQIGLTAEGVKAASSIYSKHRVLRRFFSSFLGLPPEIAEQDACTMEHSLSPEAIDKLVRYFEYIEICPEAAEDIKRFQNCSAVNPEAETCPHQCDHVTLLDDGAQLMSIAEMQPGEKGRVCQIEGEGAIRQRLLDMGILPNTTLELERKAPTGDPLWIKLQGFEMALRRSEAKLVSIKPV
jgi:DtxR family transcriptional regulator, Mn-dependent transcriptional regulator